MCSRPIYDSIIVVGTPAAKVHGSNLYSCVDLGETKIDLRLWSGSTVFEAATWRMQRR